MPIMLVWWGIGTLGLYSWAGEKMPWLIIHVALPPVLLGAWAFARTLGWWRAADHAPVSLFAATPVALNGAGEDAPTYSSNGHGEQAEAPATAVEQGRAGDLSGDLLYDRAVLLPVDHTAQQAR